MSEADVVARTPWPRTRAGLAADLRQLGVEAGRTLLVHSSLSAIGWVAGGPVAVIQALMDVLTPAGTLVMPAHSTGLTDPASWQNPPAPETWWPEIRQHTPAFDPQLTPTRGMGQIAEAFRTWPDVLRSYHPHHSFAAWGQRARFITAEHSLDYSMGEGSPLARIYDLDGWVLLLGVGYENNTSFHLAEHRLPDAPQILEGGPIYLQDGRRVWQEMHDIELDADRFGELGADFEQAALAGTHPDHPRLCKGAVGNAGSRLFRQRPAVDFAVSWLLARRLAER